jgi:hypothetical protein
MVLKFETKNLIFKNNAQGELKSPCALYFCAKIKKLLI